MLLDNIPGQSPPAINGGPPMPSRPNVQYGKPLLTQPRRTQGAQQYGGQQYGGQQPRHPHAVLQQGGQIGQQASPGAIGQQAAQPAAPQPSPQTYANQPSQMYPDQFTQQAGNLAAALAVKGHNDYYTANTPMGMGAGSGMVQYGMGRDLGTDLASARFAPQQIALQHQTANAQQALQQQQARDQEAMGWGQLGLRNQRAADQLQLQQNGGLLQFLLGTAGTMGG